FRSRLLSKWGESGFVFGPMQRSKRSEPCCRKSPTAGRPATANSGSNQERGSPNHNQRNAPVLVHERVPNQSTAEGGAMADLDVTKKAQIYHTLAQLNSLFPAIVEHCQTLQTTGILTPKYTRLYQGFAQELQAELNEDLLQVLQQTELDDAYRYGKVRQEWEKYLADPNDVFIHAAERKKQLAKQGKRKQRQKARG